jgi:ribonucleoside-diphosphate reductase beta chain
MDVKGDVLAERPSQGETAETESSFFSFVALDADERPTELPTLRCPTDEQRERRDESLHVGFGVDLVQQIRTEYPGVWTDAFGDEVVDLIARAVELEQIYARKACPDEILGMGPEQFAEYVEHVADRRLDQLDLPEQYGTDNPLPWLSEQVDLNREENFFEMQVTEYQSGGSLDW